MNRFLIAVMGMMMLLAAAGSAQVPDGTDINTAIPIYFGQVVNDIGDSRSAPLRVYSIALAKGQQISATLTSPQGLIELSLYAPGRLTVAGNTYFGSSGVSGTVAESDSGGPATSWTYAVPTSGIYYVVTYFGATGAQYSLQINAQGTPLTTPNPQSAGCVTGQVDYITYSLQLIAASLPDEASIGGTKLCSTCTVKPPAYPQLVSKLETAMGSNVGVSACYDATGNIFQLKLMHP
jgi:hypothetical protein